MENKTKKINLTSKEVLANLYNKFLSVHKDIPLAVYGKCISTLAALQQAQRALCTDNKSRIKRLEKKFSGNVAVIVWIN
jgi:hypothetical protein